MDLKEAYLDRVARDVEDLPLRIARLMASFAKQKTTVHLEHYWELERVRMYFAEFMSRLTDLEDAGPLQVEENQTAVETTWNGLVRAVDELQSKLAGAKGSSSRTHLTRDCYHNNLPLKCTTRRSLPD